MRIDKQGEVIVVGNCVWGVGTKGTLFIGGIVCKIQNSTVTMRTVLFPWRMCTFWN